MPHMRSIAVYVPYVPGRFDGLITSRAAALGFSVDYYEDIHSLRQNIDRYEVLYGDAGPEAIKNSHLRWVCSHNAGVEKYLPDDAMPEGCLLSNSSGAYGPTIAEHIIMVLLMLMRRMPEYQSAMLDRSWPCFSPIRSIAGSSIIMLGTGDIGSNTARRLSALGARVTGVCRSGKSTEPAFCHVAPIAELNCLLPHADALIMALPSTPHTQGILSRERIALLNSQSLVINVGRGSAIDQDALVEALQSRRIGGAALDVMQPEPLPPEHPLWSCPNTIITPHISGNDALDSTCEADVSMFLADLERYARGEAPLHLVNRNTGY